MARAKPAPKRKPRQTLPLLGAAGASLAMVGGSSAATSTADVTPPRNDPQSLFVLGEEEISDVSLGTFYVFDQEIGIGLIDEKVAARCGGCRGCGGCAVARCGGRCGGGAAIVRCGGCGGGAAIVRCGVARCAVARCRCGVGCGVGVVGCVACGCSCAGSCWRWNGWNWTYVCW
jgi:hypothetical protein